MRGIRHLKPGRAAVLLLCSALAGGAAAAYPPATSPEPASVPAHRICITYRSAPARRGAVLKRFETVVLPRIERWCASRPGAEARMLEATLTGADGPWDVMLLLRFDAPEVLAAWMEQERSMPAGLLPEEYDGVEDVHTTRLDALAGRTATMTEQTLALVRPYGYTDPEIYPDYVRAYLEPELEAWRGAGTIDGYEVLVNPFPEGRAWDILLIQYYRNSDALARRENVRGATIDSLRANPAWTLLHDGKNTFRSSSDPASVAVVAQPVIRR